MQQVRGIEGSGQSGDWRKLAKQERWQMEYQPKRHTINRQRKVEYLGENGEVKYFYEVDTLNVPEWRTNQKREEDGNETERAE